MTSNPSTAAGVPAPFPASTLWSSPWFGRLFLAELWERFAFYGLQAILVLYAVAPAGAGGLGLSSGTAAALFGAFLGITFMLALPGGWFADRVLGQQRALVLGLGLVAVGCLTLAAARALTVPGLLFVSVGFGLFKPNHQTLINILAGSAGRREATIATFYLGIQATGLIAPLIIGSLGERVSWRVALASIGVVVALGSAVTAAGLRGLGPVGARRARPLAPAQARAVLRRLVQLGLLSVLVLLAALAAEVLTAQLVLMIVGLTLIAAPWAGYRRLRRSPGLTEADRGRLSVMLALMSAAAVFWLLAGQDASVLTLFAKDSTDRSVAGFVVPASWLQAATPLFMLLLAPLFAWQLPRLGARFSVPAKFTVGLVLVGVSFLVMAVAAGRAEGGALVSPGWLLVVYLLHAGGEIIIAAVSISSIADLVPQAYLGQAIGIYWLFAALGGGLSSQVSALVDVLSGPVYYLLLAGTALLVAATFMIFRPRLSAPFAAAKGPHLSIVAPL